MAKINIENCEIKENNLEDRNLSDILYDLFNIIKENPIKEPQIIKCDY